MDNANGSPSSLLLMGPLLAFGSRHVASFQLESPQQESPFNVADLLGGLPAHGPLDPSLSSHHHSVGPLQGLSPHDTLGPMDTFLDAIDWLTPAASEVDTAYSEAPTPYEYEYDDPTCVRANCIAPA